MKNNIKKVFVIFFIVGLIFLVPKVQAASASISATKNSATTGESVTINVYINAAAWNLRVSGNGISGDSIVGYDSDGNNVSTSKAFSLNTSSAGTYTISLTGDVTDGVTDANSSISTSVTVTVSAPVQTTPSTGGSSSSGGGTSNNSGGTSSSKPNSTTNNKPTTTTTPKPNEEEKKSNDATLKSLVVEGYELYPEFNAATKEYSVKVANDVTSINILPTANSDKATCLVEGNMEELQVGQNDFNIVVTAEDGKINYYKVTITRERESLSVLDIKISYIDEEGNEKYLVLDPEFVSEVLEYNINNVSYLVSKINIEVLTNLEEAKIEIVGNEELVEGENTITITVTMLSETEEDDEVLVYSIILNKEQAPKVTLLGKIKNWFKGITGVVSTWYKDNQNRIIVAALTFCIVTLAGLTVYLIVDYKKYKKLIEKIAEITKLNSSKEYVVNTEALEVGINKANEKVEEDNSNIEEENIVKTKGRHF